MLPLPGKPPQAQIAHLHHLLRYTCIRTTTAGYLRVMGGINAARRPEMGIMYLEDGVEIIQKVAMALGVTNLAIGITGFIGPLVSGNQDRVINIRPGFWLGVSGMNWVHASIHGLVGLIGLQEHRAPETATRYMWLHALLFGMLSLIGWPRTGLAMPIRMVMGMAVNAPANVVHTLWAGIGLVFALKQRN